MSLDTKDKVLRFIKGILFVPKCAGCGETLALTRLELAEGVLCDRCHAQWISEKYIMCPECGRPISGCSCSTERLINSGCGVLMSLVPYFSKQNNSDIVHSILFGIKNNNNSALFNFLAMELCYRVLPIVLELGNENVVITYAPRTNKALREKGHDQSKILAAKLAKLLKVQFCVCIIRKRKLLFEKKQKDLNEEERFLNAASSFGIKKKKCGSINKKCVIIVDDLITTGASLGSCVKLLKENGAGSTMGLTIARTVLEKEDKPT